MHLPMGTDPRAQVVVRQRSMRRFIIAVIVVIAVAATAVADIAVVTVVVVATGREKSVSSRALSTVLRLPIGSFSIEDIILQRASTREP